MPISYTTVQSRTVPYKIGLYRYVSGTTLSGAAQSPLGIYTGMPNYGIGWWGADTLYQVQWRYKRRLTPAESVYRGYGGDDVWVPWDGDLSTGQEGAGDEWGVWQGIDLDTDPKTYTTPAAYVGTAGLYAVDTSNGAYTPMTLTLPYNLTTYDCAKIQIRSRVSLTYTTPEQVSNWGSAEVTLAPIPTLSSISAGLNEDGGVALTVNTNWTRDGNLFLTNVTDADGVLVATISETVDADFVLTIPADKWAGGAKLYLKDTYLITGDGAQLRIADNSYTVGDPSPVTPVPTPTIDVADDGTVTVSGATYDSVRLRGSYTDEEGNVYDELVDMVLTADGWVGDLKTPPLDVEITLVVICTVGDDWDYWTETLTVPSDGLVMFSWGDETFSIRYNPDRQITISLEGDVVGIAGSALPKSRHSMSRTSSMTMTGTLINPAEDAYNGDGWLADLEKLNAPHDWYYRTPNGLRRRVSIESITPAWATQSANRIMDVTITMQEVAD